MATRVGNRPAGQQRVVCTGCLRPQEACYCSTIPSIENRTRMVIIQDRRERFHPFNTARIVERSLQNCTLICDRISKLQNLDFSQFQSPGLLYPSDDAIDLEDLPHDQCPQELVLLDGTWYQAKDMMRRIPALQSLPRYKLSPSKPGQYRIRREPTVTSLSTVEATVLALQAMEGATPGIEKMLDVFNAMVETQLAHPKSEYGWRRNRKRLGTPLNIPAMVVHDLPNVVVAYGESTGGERSRVPGKDGTPKQRLPIYWVAQRMVSGETFEMAIDWPDTEDGYGSCRALTDDSLRHLQLTRNHFERASTPDGFASAWNQFLRPTDQLAVYNHSTLELLRAVTPRIPDWFVMKCVQLNPDRKNGGLASLIQSKSIDMKPARTAGRAGVRLAAAVALAQYLHEFGLAGIKENSAENGEGV